MTILAPKEAAFVGDVNVLIIGGGGCGLCAALAVRDAGGDALVLERDATALGSTAMSTGLIPAAGTRFQAEKGIADSPEKFVGDILKKTHGQTDTSMARHLAEESVPTLDWLVDHHAVPLSLVESFDFPGHSMRRMHGTPNRTGAELMGALHNAVSGSGADVITQAPATALFAEDDGTIKGVRVERADGTTEDIGCGALVLACSGFAGNSKLVEQHIPAIQDALFFGHPGNKGDALNWGLKLGAEVADVSSYQGHGSVAGDHGVSIMWAHITLGGIQVNASGRRFSNEALGYSEQAAHVTAQHGGFVWSIYDEEIHERLKEYEDYRDALATGCVLSADTVESLCRQTNLPESLRNTLETVEQLRVGIGSDEWGRDFSNCKPLKPPFKAVKVNGALFHTQGGLCVDNSGQVKRQDGSLFPNLFAGGGAARSISGPSADGYLSGNGLLTATTYGRLAGFAAADLVNGTQNEI
ncbi:MAG: FAD-dependent oxidoreductase [Rhodospirillaceae bacterium]